MHSGRTKNLENLNLTLDSSSKVDNQNLNVGMITSSHQSILHFIRTPSPGCHLPSRCQITSLIHHFLAILQDLSHASASSALPHFTSGPSSGVRCSVCLPLVVTDTLIQAMGLINQCTKSLQILYLLVDLYYHAAFGSACIVLQSFRLGQSPVFYSKAFSPASSPQVLKVMIYVHEQVYKRDFMLLPPHNQKSYSLRMCLEVQSLCV
jgi:hypothetical protein